MANFAALVAALQHNGVSFQVKKRGTAPIRVHLLAYEAGIQADQAHQRERP